MRLGTQRQGTTTAQTWQFLAAAIGTSCPEQMAILASIGEPNGGRDNSTQCGPRGQRAASSTAITPIRTRRDV